MGFDIREKLVLQNWMATTLRFAMVGSGRDEVDEAEVHASVSEVVSTLPQPVAMREVAVAFLSKAQDLLGVEVEEGGVDEGKPMEPSYLTNVMQWAMLTAAAVFVGKGKPFDHEKLEAVVDDKIICRIQGNKSHAGATRDDLDKIVRKAVAWGLAELGVVPIGG